MSNMMNQNQRLKKKKVKPHTIPMLGTKGSMRSSEEDQILGTLQFIKEETKVDVAEDTRDYDFLIDKSEIERFIEISKYFSSPLHKTASYICENQIVSYPYPFRIQFKRGGVTTQHIKFTNLTLEPVYIKLYKMIPDLEQLKFINLSISRCKRIPAGLSFNLEFVYDDVNENSASKAKMIFVTSRKTTTPCYQICEIGLEIEPLK